MEDSKIEIRENKTEQYFIDKLNNSLEHIRKESWNTNPPLIDNIEFLHSNSPVLSVYNSDEESDCFDDIHEFQSKTSFQKLTFQDVKRSLDKYYECEDKYINELDLLTIYLNGQKNLYVEAKQLAQFKLNLLIFPCIIGSTVISFFSPFIRGYEWSGIFIASVNAFITCCLSLIHYLKLESLVDSYSQLIQHYDKLESSLQITTSKIFFLEDKKEKNTVLLKNIEEFDTKMNEIKNNINVVIPTELKNLYPIIYHIHIFSFIKRIETYKRNLIMKFKDVKNEINYIVWKYDSNMNQRVKNRLEFISDLKIKLKEELLYYKNAYGVMEELFIQEIKQNEVFGLSKYFKKKKKPVLEVNNPVIHNYLNTIFVD
jgi:hypothetical protein